MNKIDKIATIIKRTMAKDEIIKPTLRIVYDSIIEVYPKLHTADTNQYKCIRKIIIEEIATFYENTQSKEVLTLQIILSRILKECKQ